MRVRTFWWVSQIGMLPGTVVYLYAGSSAPSLNEFVQEGAGSIMKPQIVLAFVLLGVFPLAVRKIMGSLKPK